MLTPNDLQEMKQKTETEKQRLIDINDVQKNASLPFSECAEHFFTLIKNPYNFRCGDIPVLIRFSNNSKYLSQKLERYLSGKKLNLLD